MQNTCATKGKKLFMLHISKPLKVRIGTEECICPLEGGQAVAMSA